MSEIFFDTEDVSSVLSGAVVTISRFSSLDSFEDSRNRHLRQILLSMINQKKEWDEKCSISIKSIGDRFLSRLQAVSADATREDLDDLFAMAFRFLVELDLSTSNGLNMELEAARTFGTERNNEFLPRQAGQIDWAIKNLSTYILKSFVGSEHVQSLRNLNATYVEVDRRRAEWSRELKEHEEKVESLKVSLETYATAFNFVGLYEGFDLLAKAKDKQKKAVRAWLVCTGLLIFLPLIVELLFIRNNLEDIEKYQMVLILSLVPTLSITALLVYYFRVFLHNFNSLNSQILQLDLRKTLCRFIQKYSDYAMEMKTKNGESLSRFENIIFSPLAPNDEKLPSTFDGIEQLSGLIKSLKQ